MKIDVQEPYKSLYVRGYLAVNPENRGVVTLYTADGKAFSTSYARYLMSVKLGYIVPDGLHVDHIDNDKTNDDINNLQLLTPEQNREKERIRYIVEEQVCYGYHCAKCNLTFILTERERNNRLAQKTELAFCSRSCAFKYNKEIGKTTFGKRLSDDKIEHIKTLRRQGLSAYKIKDITGISRDTIMKYW